MIAKIFIIILTRSNIFSDINFFSFFFFCRCIIIIYLAIFVIRFFMLLFCYPLMQYLSEGYSFNDLYFSTFAGLRGAVSLALCIVIQSHVDSDNAKDVHLVTFPKEEIRQVKVLFYFIFIYLIILVIIICLVTFLYIVYCFGTVLFSHSFITLFRLLSCFFNSFDHNTIRLI